MNAHTSEWIVVVVDGDNNVGHLCLQLTTPEAREMCDAWQNTTLGRGLAILSMVQAPLDASTT